MILKTYARACCSFFWFGMKQDILTFVTECEIFQCNKGETMKTLGTLQPLFLPSPIWTNVSMEFITSLPKSGNKSIIMVVFIDSPNMPIFVPLQNPSLQHWWPKFSLIKNSNCLECLLLLCLLKIPHSLAIFGKGYSSYMSHCSK